jgi:transposase
VVGVVAETQQDQLQLDSEEIGAHPLIQPLIERLRLREFFAQAFAKPDARLKLPHVDSALLLVRNFVLSRHPLYGVAQWAERFEPLRLELTTAQVALINDDRLGRLLDQLFMVDRRSLMTRIIVHMVKEFGLEMARIHNDSTSVSFSGEYRERAPRPDGRIAPRIVHGFNKDHRPDLKQLLWTLSITADGGVPVHYNVDDGNVNDDQTHRRTWDILREITGTPRFIYTADCKLCSRTNMAHIAERGGWFITVLPKSRKEDAEFKTAIATCPVAWHVIWERPPLRRQSDPPDVYEAYEAAQHGTPEGYRVVWFRSSEKWVRDEAARQQAIDRARLELHRLGEKLQPGRHRLQQRRQVQAAVDSILQSTGTTPWVRVALVGHEHHRHKQQKPGKPTWQTPYLRVTTTVWELVVTVDQQAVRASATADGLFPLVTNLPHDTHAPLELLQIYKYQAFVEKRHEQLKTVAEVVPVNFKSPARIDAFLFLFFVAITIDALLERQLRQAMVAHQLESLPLYPEARQCKAPTAGKILALFAHQRRHRLADAGRHVKTFWDPITATQRIILQLLDVPADQFGAEP